MNALQQWRTEQRFRLTEQRLKFADELRSLYQAALFEQLQSVIKTQPTGIVGFYWPVRGEIDCRDFICELIKQGWQAALPKIVGPHQALQFHQWNTGSSMQAEIWDIPVPQNTPVVEPTVFIIPLVGFDSDRHRLGNGGGFYDRTLAAQENAFSIGIGYQWMLLQSIQPQAHDVPMNAIITEERIYS